MTTDLRHLADLVADDGDLDLATLPDHLADGPLEVGVLTDEELHWFGPDPDAAPDPEVDAPRLGRLDAEAQQVALDTALWMLQARGELVLEDDRPGEVLRLGVRALGVALRSSASARCTVTVTRDGTAERAVVWWLPGVGTLAETVSAAGLHHLVLRHPDDQARWLAGLLGPCVDASGPVQRVADPAQLSPPLDELRRGVRTELRCVLAVRDAAPDAAGRVRILHVLTTDDGTWALRQHADTTGAEQVVLEPLVGDEVAPLLGAFLDPTAAPGDLPLTTP